MRPFRSFLSLVVAVAFVGRANAQQSTRDNRALLDSIRQANYNRMLAEARARPRHWMCDASEKEVREAATAAAGTFVGEKGAAMQALRREHAIPGARDEFLRDFRAVTDANECRRLAEALDRQIGLVEDRIRVYRIGKIYLLPEWGQGGMMVELNGRIISVFVIPN